MEPNIFYDEIDNRINAMHNVLIDIKDGTTDHEKINELFRAIHTVKGSADLLYMDTIVSMCHKAEDLLTEIREGRIVFTDKIAHLFVEIKDFIKLVLEDTFQGVYDYETIDNLETYLKKKIESFAVKIILLITDGINSIDEYKMDGYTFVLHTDLEEGLIFLKEHDIAMLFIDIGLPNVSHNNFQAITQTKDIKKYLYLPIVLIVPPNYPLLKQAGKIIGAKAWIKKPVDPNQVKTIVTKVLG